MPKKMNAAAADLLMPKKMNAAAAAASAAAAEVAGADDHIDCGNSGSSYRSPSYKSAGQGNNRSIHVPVLRAIKNASEIAMKAGEDGEAAVGTPRQAEALSRLRKMMDKVTLPTSENEGEIESAAVGGLLETVKVANDNPEILPERPQQHQSTSPRPPRTPTETVREILGACGTSEALVDQIRTSRKESVEFVRNLSLPERFKKVSDELVTRCSQISPINNSNEFGAATAAPAPEKRQQSRNSAEKRTAAAGTRLERSPSDDAASCHTMDTKEERLEEMQQLERMTSFNTLDTDTKTITTAATDDNSSAGGLVVEMLGIDDKDGVIRDDDGNEIPEEMINDLKARQERKLKSRRRKKAVQFDYPPISSLRECPRADPKDLGGLFFTEQELEQIEDDRTSCKMVDDVEVVAVPNKELDLAQSSHSKLSKREARKAALRRKMQGGSPSPKRSDHPSSPNDVTNGDVGKSDASSSGKAEKGPMLKGVQIYLRQRSTNEKSKK